MLRALVLALFLVPTPAGAQRLWRDVEAGMPASQVQALYPAGPGISHGPDTSLIEEIERLGACSADVRVGYVAGVVDSVTVDSLVSMRGGTCAEEAQASLVRRHGEPDEVSDFDAGPNSPGRAQRWTRKKLRIELIRHGKTGLLSGLCLSIACRLQPPSAFNDQDDWTITYRAAKARRPGAGGK